MTLRSSLRAVLQGIMMFALTVGALHAQQASTYRFAVSFPSAQSAEPLDGRLLLILSTDPSEEPRLQISNSVRTQMIFGLDVDALKSVQSVTLDDAAFGYPVRYLHEVPPGDYFVQVVMHKYETFHRADGHTVKLPMDRGEGQHWQLAPGNLYSTPRKITLRAGGEPISIVLDQVIPADPRPERHSLHPPHQNSERAAHEILGPPDVPQRERPGPRGIRRAPQRAFSADDFRRSLQ